MLKLEINGKVLVPVRLAPFLMGWEFSPDTLARILAHREGFYRGVPPSYHFQPDKSFHRITPKEWDTCLADLKILTNELKAGGQIEDANSPEWRIKSIQVLPAAAFFWLDDLENTWNILLSKERIALPSEREGDRGLNLFPQIPRDVLKFIYEGFESLLIHQQMHDNGYQTDIIRFTALHLYLILDPYYGTESEASASIVGSIYRDNNGNQLFQQFGTQFLETPCESDQQRHLIYLWCGLMGLPVYRDGQPLGWQGKDFLNHWTEDFDLRLDEIRDFLRNQEWPLPTIFFPDEPDNTELKVGLEREGFVTAFDEFAEKRPQLEKDLAELKAIQPESMEDRRQK